MKKLGFTLAEVLITLVIIGVIAAMTVPTLMQNTNSQEFRSALKKAISTVNQALTLHYALTSQTANDYSNGSNLMTGLFTQRLSVLQNSVGTTDLKFTNTTACQGAVFVTADGIMYCINSDFSNNTGTDSDTSPCNSYNTKPCTGSGGAGKPNMWIDVNGKKGPDKITDSATRPKDIYQAVIYAQRIIPYGEPTQQVMYDAGSI